MYKGSTFKQCISRHEDYLALKLNLKPGMVCLDVGCGVGGPQREIARFSQAHVVGLNNNEYQVERCNYLAQRYGLSNRVNTVKVYNFNRVILKRCHLRKILLMLAMPLKLRCMLDIWRILTRKYSKL